MSSRLHRRHWLGLGLGLSASAGGHLFAGPDERAQKAAPIGSAVSGAEGSSPFDLLDLRLEGSRDLARRAVVLVPRDLPAGTRVPLLILLHGLGETTNEEAGVRAWIDRYGLLRCHTRLAHPPVAPESRRGD